MNNIMIITSGKSKNDRRRIGTKLWLRQNVKIGRRK